VDSNHRPPDPPPQFITAQRHLGCTRSAGNQRITEFWPLSLAWVGAALRTWRLAVCCFLPVRARNRKFETTRMRPSSAVQNSYRVRHRGFTRIKTHIASGTDHEVDGLAAIERRHVLLRTPFSRRPELRRRYDALGRLNMWIFVFQVPSLCRSKILTVCPDTRIFSPVSRTN
jgi:hypothetical protein